MRCKIRPSEQISKRLKEIFESDANELIDNILLMSAQRILQEALEKEMDDFLGREWYEHSTDNGLHGWRNGYTGRNYKTAEGVLRVQKPRVRGNDKPFESKIMRKIASLDHNLKRIAMESYVRGLSTRDIESTFVDENGKAMLSRSSASKMSKCFYDEYEKFSRRDLSAYDVAYLFIDGVYEAVRNYTNNQAILCAWAICADGSKRLLHLMAAESESSQSWLSFFEDMLSRGLRQPLLVISDGGSAMKGAIAAKFPRAERQRCIAHKMRNLLSKLPKEAQELIKKELHRIYYADDIQTAEQLSSAFIDRHSGNYPSMVKCFNDDLPACLRHLKYPEGHRKFIRTTNLIERAFVEEKRRTKVIPQHYNERGAIGLVFSVLIRASEKWKRVSMTDLELTQLKHLKKLIYPNTNDFNLISEQYVA